LIVSGDKIAIAFSGGKDSSNTLFLLNKIFKNNPKVVFFTITINEGIEGYRNKCLEKSESFCKKLNVKQYIFSFKEEFGLTIDDLSKKMDSGYCGTCGLLRRYLLNKKARELGATKLATGHNLDDEFQSILMNIQKGELLRLAMMGTIPKISKNSKLVQRIKPLILIPENESKLFAKINKIPFGKKNCPNSVDNPLRGETRKFLNRLEETSPGIKYSLYESASKFVPFIKNKFKSEKINYCKNCKEPSSRNICRVCEILKNL
jgi:uncharacterized protein (TIGR00269 family)